MQKARMIKNSGAEIARSYIKDNYNLLKKSEIVENLLNMTGLKQDSILHIFREVDLELRKGKEIKREPKIKYKGREREFFKFDDRRLYIGLIKK